MSYSFNLAVVKGGEGAVGMLPVLLAPKPGHGHVQFISLNLDLAVVRGGEGASAVVGLG